ncbi:MAG: TadE/TadG family type IV pilus assembly protein [Actinomycetes bacterium]
MRPLGGDDRGSAPVEFALVSVLLTVLFLGVIQLALAVHVRSMLIASAAEGARLAARADRGPEEGIELTRRLVATSLSGSYAQDVTAGFQDVAGARTVYVQVRAALPIIGLLGPTGSLTVRGHALDEG